MIHESRYLRIWKVSDELMSLLPPERHTPIHENYQDRAIDIGRKHGLDYVTAVTCDWHNDWPEVFEYLVVSGRATLYFGDVPLTKGESEHEPKVFTKHTIERGCCLQLWPMVPHRISSLKTVAMLSNEVDPWGKGKDNVFSGFGGVAPLEVFFKHLILEKYTGKRPKASRPKLIKS